MLVSLDLFKPVVQPLVQQARLGITCSLQVSVDAASERTIDRYMSVKGCQLFVDRRGHLAGWAELPLLTSIRSSLLVDEGPFSNHSMILSVSPMLR